MGALNDLVRTGLVRYIGVSNWAAWQIAKALGISSLHGTAKFASLQAYYTVAGRDLEREIIPMLTSEGLGLLVWSPLAGGLLSGKYSREQKDVEGGRAYCLRVSSRRYRSRLQHHRCMKELAERKHVSVPQLAVAWLLHHPYVTSVILGAKRIEQLSDNLGAVDLTLSEEELRSLDQVSQLPAEYPGWMLTMWSQARAKQLEDSVLENGNSLVNDSMRASDLHMTERAGVLGNAFEQSFRYFLPLVRALQQTLIMRV